MRQVRYNSKIHPPWSHRKNIRGSILLQGNYAIPLMKTIPCLTELVGRTYTDKCDQCNRFVVCSCKLSEMISPALYYVHYSKHAYVRNRLGEIHLLVNPNTNKIEYIGEVGPDFSI